MRGAAMSPARSEQQRRQVEARRNASALTEEEEHEASAKAAKAILDNSTQLEKIQYRELFNFFDIDKDRTWGTAEFSRRMTEIGYPVTPDQAADLLSTAGVRDLDAITFDDFVQLMPKLKAFRDHLERDALRLFRLKDTHGRGWITPHALKEVLTSISGQDGMGPEQIDRIVLQADRERTGCITYDFFIRALFGTPPVLVYKPQPRKSSWFCFCGSATHVVGGDDDDDSEDEAEWDEVGKPGGAL